MVDKGKRKQVKSYAEVAKGCVGKLVEVPGGAGHSSALRQRDRGIKEE